jgi:hypothetical protein
MALKLETKFIEGTNNQYSIRNDGVVISHYINKYDINLKTMSIFYRDKIIKPRLTERVNNILVSVPINGKFKEVTVKSLVAKAFNMPNPYINKGSSILLYYKDNNPFNCSYDNLYYKAKVDCKVYTNEQEKKEDHAQRKRKQSYIRYKNLSKEQQLHKIEVTKIWQKNNLEKVSKIRKINGKRHTENITRCYVAAKLHMSTKNLSEELYDLYKNNLLLHRLIKSKKQCQTQ